MYDETLNIINKKLKEEHALYFRLYNALYKITLTNQCYTIQQMGLDINYKYDTLKDLFLNYIIYGTTLIDAINDIKVG